MSDLPTAARKSRGVHAERRNPIAQASEPAARALVGALERGEIEVVFQPEFSLADGRLIGAEALARWRRPRHGVVGADALFALAEEGGCLAQLSRYLTRRSLAQASEWPDRVRLSLNVAPGDLVCSFADELLQTVALSGFSPERLTLEITEQALLRDLDAVAASLARLKEHGLAIALDDFGSGFCNFAYLKRLPLDRLKLDRSMLQDIEHDPRDLAVLRAIVALATALGLVVVAEGIENEAQRAIAAREGCTSFQGYLRSPPLSGEAFLKLARG